MYTAALVGCGRIGYSLGLDLKREQPASHTRAINENPRIKLVAGCDTDAQTLCAWGKANPSVAVYRDSLEMYANVHPDIVVVAVNERSHEKEAIEAVVSRPSLVILEKPVALNIADALKIRDMAQINSVPVMVNHERRFSRDYMLARKLVGEIGELESVHGILSSGMAVYNPNEEGSGAYSLLHDGTHLVDAVQFLLGEMRSVDVDSGKKSGLMKRALKFSREKDVAYSPMLKNPVLTGLLVDEKNCVRHVSAHYSLDACPDVALTFSGRSRYFGFEIDIRGTEGRVCIGNGFFKFYRRRESVLYSGFHSLSREKIQVPERTGYFSNMVQSAVDFLDGKSPLLSSLRTGIEDLAVVEEIKEKIRQKASWKTGMQNP